MEGGELWFRLYKGLQRPLVFRSFKGKFIYWGVGSIFVGLILTMVTAAITSIWYGLITAIITVGGGLTYTGIMQKQGLHQKTKETGIFIIPCHFKTKFKK